jgi:osmotically-inducible protein OsmY
VRGGLGCPVAHPEGRGAIVEIDDQILVITACVNALKSRSSIPSDKIKIVVSKGWVTLEGEVEWQYQKRAAENAIRYLTGVMGVSSLIAIKPRVSPTELKSKI